MYCQLLWFHRKAIQTDPGAEVSLFDPAARGGAGGDLVHHPRAHGVCGRGRRTGHGQDHAARTAINQLDKKTKAAFIFNTELSFEEILLMVLDDFGLLKPGEKLAKIDLVRRLNHFAIRQMAAGGNVVIMLDEAHNLSTKAIEGLRLISNLESEEKS